MNIADVRESAWMALDTVRANKLRSALTILGVSVGVVTVVFMVGIIQGLNKAFADQIESLGSNTIWATKFDPSIGHQPTQEEIHRKELTIEDADTIRNEASSPPAWRRFIAKWPRQFSTAVIRATLRSFRRDAVPRVYRFELRRPGSLHFRVGR